MKIKLFTSLLTLVLIVNLNACSSDSPDKEIPEEPTQEKPDKEPEESEDENCIINKNTILLQNGLDKYIDSPVKGNTLSLSSNIQASELPAEGSILLYGGISDKFPSGFLGKVSKIEKTAAGYDIQTVPASLEEAFDKLYINETIELELDDSTSVRSRSFHEDAEGYKGFQGRLTIPLGKSLHNIPGWEVKDWSASLDGKIIYGVGFAMKIQCYIDIDRINKKDSQIELDFSLKTESRLNAEIEGELGNSRYSKELWDIPIKPIILGAAGQVAKIVVIPHWTGEFFAEINGRVDFAVLSYSKDKWNIKFIYKNGKAECQKPSHEKIKDNTLNFKSVRLKGSYAVGLGTSLELRFFNLEEFNCGLNLNGGPAFTADIAYDENEGTDLIYSKLKDSSLSFTPINLNGSLEVKLPFLERNNKDENNNTLCGIFPYTLFNKDFLKTELFLFPEFEPFDPQRNKEDISVAYKAKRLTLLPYEYGLRLMDDKKKIVEDYGENQVQCVKQESEKEEYTRISATFTETDSKKTYYACPTLKTSLFNKVIQADPTLEIKGIEMTEKEALIALYEATDGDHWAVNTNWCSDKPLSQWYGITTNKEGKVTEINLSENRLNGTFELSNFQALTKIECGNNTFDKNTSTDNTINEVTVQKCPQLLTINFANSSLKEFIAKNCDMLKTLNVTQNSLTELDLSEYTLLYGLHIDKNQISKLTGLSNLSNLHMLYCSENPLNELQLANLSELEYLSCKNAQLKELDLNGLSNLKTLECDKNLFTELDLSHCLQLNTLWCTESELTSLDVSGLKELEYVNCPWNRKLKTFYAHHNPKLQKIWLGESFGGGEADALEKFEAVDCPSLKEILCLSAGKSTSYVLKGCNALESFACSNSGVLSLDLRECVNLRKLSCDLCQLKSLDVTPCTQLEELICSNNPQLKSISLQTNKALKKLWCTGCNFSNLDVYAALDLNELYTGKHETIRLRKKPAYIQCEEWGDYNPDIYKEPYHLNGYQYPEFIYR